MILNDVYLKSIKILKDADIDSASFDAVQILKKIFGVTRSDVAINKNLELCPKKCDEFFKEIQRRATGTPLQYILGKWDFMGREFDVCPGVLIPRDDTEVLVKASVDFLKDKKNASVIDLCSGTGIVAITISKTVKDCTVKAIEISDQACKVLRQNIQKHLAKNVCAIQADVFDLSLQNSIKEVDLIVSNPPYIPYSDLFFLQKEVKEEPSIALDGGIDGLKFYKLFAHSWARTLKSSGKLCLEVGFDQANLVVDILKNSKYFKNFKLIKDVNNIFRVVTCEKI